jgi:ankyrin repeat protein
MSGNLVTVQFLVERMSAIPELANKNDENCLMSAVRNKHNDVVRYLCTKVVKPNGSLEIDYECSRNGLTPFGRAVL